MNFVLIICNFYERKDSHKKQIRKEVHFCVQNVCQELYDKSIYNFLIIILIDILLTYQLHPLSINTKKLIGRPLTKQFDCKHFCINKNI